MATSVFKTFLDSDKTTTRTLLHEYIPITGTLMSGTYGSTTTHLGSEPHVKTFAHGMFQSVYDYPHLSSSANHVMDVSVGIHSDSGMLGHVASVTFHDSTLPANDSTITIPDSTGWTYTIKFITADAACGSETSCYVLGDYVVGTKTQAITVSMRNEDDDGTINTAQLAERFAEALRKGREAAQEYTVRGAAKLPGFFNAAVKSGTKMVRIKQPTAGSSGLTTIATEGATNCTIVQFAAPATSAMVDKKLNMYSQMSQILMGYDTSNNVAKFDEDGIVGTNDASKMSSCVFVSLSRLITKDEIKKGSFMMDVDVNLVASTTNVSSTGYLGNATAGVANSDNQMSATNARIVRITDAGMATGYKSGSPAGEVGILVADSQKPNDTNNLDNDDGTQKVGLIYYQAGIVVLTSSLFVTKDGNPSDAYISEHAATNHPGLLAGTNKIASALKSHPSAGQNDTDANCDTWIGVLSGSTMDRSADFVRSRIVDLTFNNTTELNSTVYFCRARHNEFNYSANRTYLSGSKIRVKKLAQDLPRTYITTVGLYSANNELMAVAKLSEPIRKDPTNEATVRVRLDY